MPPKDSKAKPNGKVEKTEKKPPVTPEKPKGKVKAEQSPAKKATPKATPRKSQPRSVEFKSLATDQGGTIPVDVGIEGVSGQAIQNKFGTFGQLVNLQAPDKFNVVKTVLLDDGPYQGYQAIIIKPAQPFRFLELDKEIRARVYKEYFACKGIINEPIVLDGKRSTNKEAYAKSYADGNKNRVALLAVCKEIKSEATEILYTQTLKFDSTATLMDFLSSLETEQRARLQDIEIRNFNRATARNTLNLLAEATNLKRVHFDFGVSTETDPGKAAKAFHAETYKFFKVLGASKEGGPTAVVEILNFTKSAFAPKEGKNTWTEEMVEEFKEALKSKVK
ncbi:Hypothetical predicted protein [Lecanosticta acicola]|uniref:Uncharacterized protein n=1 Tax=Lecanosticta acicola TaxID=111012 RepID=A0AAI8Z1K8_9PEZI|nr:Hypothetical predicted protein [Lecanosticta acicola]